MKYEGSPFGKMSGAIAGQVASSWKGIKYGRAYVVPNNPDTDDQKLQRAMFKNISQFGRRLVDSVLNLYTLPPPKLMSAFNKFMSVNVPLQTADVIDYAAILMVQGSLYPGSGTYLVVDESLATGVLTWNPVLIGEAKGTDPVHVVLYNVEKDVFAYSPAAVRSAGTVTIITTGWMQGEHVQAWMFFTDAAMTKSSDSIQISAVIQA